MRVNSCSTKSDDAMLKAPPRHALASRPGGPPGMPGPIQHVRGERHEHGADSQLPLARRAGFALAGFSRAVWFYAGLTRSWALA